MKYRVIKIIAILIVVAGISSCVTHRVKTDRKAPRRGAYHGAGDRWW